MSVVGEVLADFGLENLHRHIQHQTVREVDSDEEHDVDDDGRHFVLGQVQSHGTLYIFKRLFFGNQ